MLSISRTVSNYIKVGWFFEDRKQRVQAGRAKEVFINRIESRFRCVREFNKAMKWKNIDVYRRHIKGRKGN